MTESEGPVPSWRDRLGGRWAISWQAFVLSAPLAVISVLLANNTQANAATNQSTGRSAQLLLVGLVSAGLLGIWTYALHRTLFRNRHLVTLPARLVVVCSLISGLVFGAGVSLGLWYFNIESSQSVFERLIFTTLIAAWWGLTLQLLLEARWRFASQRDVLIEQAVQMEIARLQEAEIISVMHLAFEEEVDLELATARASLDARLSLMSEEVQEAQWTEVAQSLRDTAQDSVRPLSKRLWTELGEQYPRPSITSALRNIVRAQPFRPFVVAGVYLVSTAPAELHAMGTLVGLVITLLSVLTIVLTMSAANLLMNRLPQWHSAIFLLTVAFIEVVSLMFAPVRDELANRATDLGQNIGAIVISVIIIIITSGFGALRVANEHMLATFQSDVDVERISAIARSRQIAELAREASRVLHGSVQTKLISCAAAIDKASTAGDVEEFNRALLQARAVLEAPIEIISNSASIPLRELVERKCVLWSGLCRFTIDIDVTLQHASGTLAINVSRVVEEGVANAVRHGNADEISVSITHADSGIVHIEITDNGDGPLAGPTGLGTTLMQQMSKGLVQLVKRSDGHGATLLVDLYDND